MKIAISFVFILLMINASSQSVGINTDGTPSTDPSAMLEIKKGNKSKVKIRSLSYFDTSELQLSNRTAANAGTDFNFRAIREEGLFISTSSDFPWLTSDSLMSLSPRGNVGIGGLARSSAALDVKSTTKGLLIPRMTSSQRQAVASPDIGLLVFDLDKKTLFLYDGYQWLPLAFVDKNALPPTPRYANDPHEGDWFGASVSISGDYAIIGAASNNCAYIFSRIGNNWQQQAKLTTSDGEYIGDAVSISGDYAVVGSPTADIAANFDQGAAYIFVRSGSTWTQQAKISGTDGIWDGEFGGKVSISGDYVIIGCNYQQNAYIFYRSGTIWNQQAKLISTDFVSGDAFGQSVGISGGYAIVGAPYKDVTRTNQGAAYIFVRSGTNWTQQARLLYSFPADNDNFGSSVAIAGDYAMVGAPGVDGTYTDQGYIIMFARTGTVWNSTGSLYSPDAAASFRFGEWHGYTALTPDYALVTGQGKGYLYKRTGTSWSFVRRINELTGSGFGAVGISGYNLILGAPSDNTTALNAGAVSFLNIE